MHFVGLLWPLLTSRSAGTHDSAVPASPFQASGETSPGKNDDLPRTIAGSTPLPLGRRSFAVSGPLAPVRSASYPVPVRRLTGSFHASFSVRLTTNALRFPSVPATRFREDFHLQVIAHAGPTTMEKPNRLLATKTVRLEKEDLNIRFAELGDPANPTVLLLHGVPENLQAWYAVAPLLAEKYHVLAIDWPGFGGSDPLTSPEDYTSRRFAEVIVDFMDSLQIRQANLVATDIALLPSLLVGLEHPSRVSKLAVMDGIPFPRPQYSSWELKSFAKKGSIIGKALVRWFPRITAEISYFKGFYRGHSIPAEVRREFLADGVSKSTQEAFLSYFQNFRMGQEYFEPRAQELQTPVLVVWGKYDRFISSKLGQEIVENLPNAKLEVIDKSGHYVHMDKPQELVQVVTQFLEEAA